MHELSIWDGVVVVGYLLLLGCYAPQTRRLWRTRDASGMSPSFLGMLVSGLGLIEAWALGTGQIALAVGNGIALVNAGILAASWAWIKDQGKPQVGREG